MNNKTMLFLVPRNLHTQRELAAHLSKPRPEAQAEDMAAAIITAPAPKAPREIPQWVRDCQEQALARVMAFFGPWEDSKETE